MIRQTTAVPSVKRAPPPARAGRGVSRPALVVGLLLSLAVHVPLVWNFDGKPAEPAERPEMAALTPEDVIELPEPEPEEQAEPEPPPEPEPEPAEPAEPAEPVEAPPPPAPLGDVSGEFDAEEPAPAPPTPQPEAAPPTEPQPAETAPPEPAPTPPVEQAPVAPAPAQAPQQQPQTPQPKAQPSPRQAPTASRPPTRFGTRTGERDGKSFVPRVNWLGYEQAVRAIEASGMKIVVLEPAQRGRQRSIVAEVLRDRGSWTARPYRPPSFGRREGNHFVSEPAVLAPVRAALQRSGVLAGGRQIAVMFPDDLYGRIVASGLAAASRRGLLTDQIALFEGHFETGGGGVEFRVTGVLPNDGSPMVRVD